MRVSFGRHYEYALFYPPHPALDCKTGCRLTGIDLVLTAGRVTEAFIQRMSHQKMPNERKAYPSGPKSWKYCKSNNEMLFTSLNRITHLKSEIFVVEGSPLKLRYRSLMN